MEAAAETEGETHAPVIDVDADDDADQMPAVTTFGAGIALSGGLISLIAGYRLRQRRRRHRGAALAMPTGPAAAVEQELRTVGDPLAIEEVDHALRALARHCRDTGQDLPEIRVARFTHDTFEIYLTEPRQLPAPWTGIADQTLWALHPNASDNTGREVSEEDQQLPAPYPALVTIGQDAEGAHVLLDLESVGEFRIGGDTEAVEGILAALAIELATSIWADDLTVTLVGSIPEMEDVLQTGRIRYLPTVGRLFEEMQRRAESDRLALQLDDATDLHHARVQAKAPSTWYPEIVLLTHPLTERQETQLDQLLNDLPRVAVAAVALSDKESDWHLAAEGDGHVLYPLGLTINPQRVPTEPYRRILEIADIARHGQEISNQVTAAAVDSMLDEAAEYLQTTNPADLVESQDDAPVDTDELGDKALTEVGEEVSALAAPVAAEEETTDMEAELVPAVSPVDSVVDVGPREGQPYLRLLGPIQLVGAAGPVEEKRQKRLVEYLAYLMLTEDASNITAIDDAIWPNRKTQDNTSTRNSVTSRLRKWLGLQEGTDIPRLEMNTYVVTDVGCDWFDFQALTQGASLEEVPTQNLQAAVELLQGPVLKGAGVRYWAWAEPIQQEMISRIVDACYELAARQLVDEEYLACEATLAKGLDIEPGDEQLWRMRILAAHARHNTAAVEEATARLYAQLDAFECSPEDETDEFLSALKQGAQVADLMELI